MTPDELRAIGEMKYGRFWQSKMAKDLPRDTRTIRRWLSGKRPIRPLLRRGYAGLLIITMRRLIDAAGARLSIDAKQAYSCNCEPPFRSEPRLKCFFALLRI